MSRILDRQIRSILRRKRQEKNEKPHKWVAFPSRRTRSYSLSKCFYGHSNYDPLDATNASKQSLIGQLVKFFLWLINQALRNVCSVKWTAPSVEDMAWWHAIVICPENDNNVGELDDKIEVSRTYHHRYIWKNAVNEETN